MRLNLTQHKSTKDQNCKELYNKDFIIKLLTFDSIPTEAEIADRAIRLAEIALSEGAKEAMIGGAPFLMSPLEIVLATVGITPLYAFSMRRVIEKDGVKTSVFKHLGFVNPISSDVIDECRRYRSLLHPAVIVTIEEGMVCCESISFHPTKKRKYEKKKMFKISKAAELILRRGKEIRLSAQKETDRQEASKILKYDAWVDSLPDKIYGYRLDRKRRELTDDVGNYYFSLPKTPLHLEELEAWVRENEYIPE